VVLQVQHRQKYALAAETAKDVSQSVEAVRTPFRMIIKRPVMSGYACIPTIDMYSRDDAMVLRMDLPGIKKDDVEITATDTRLSISAAGNLLRALIRKTIALTRSATAIFRVPLTCRLLWTRQNRGQSGRRHPGNHPAKLSKDKVTSVAIKSKVH